MDPAFGNPTLKRLVEEDKTTREIEDWPHMQEENRKAKMVCPRQREWSIVLNAVQKPREVRTGSGEGKSTGNVSESCSGAVRGQEPNRSGLRAWS